MKITIMRDGVAVHAETMKPIQPQPGDVVVLSDQRAKRSTELPTYIPPNVYEDEAEKYAVPSSALKLSRADIIGMLTLFVTLMSGILIGAVLQRQGILADIAGWFR